ncbi:hypothetical protein AFLA_009363 [Aspergillus flavus NRRL3357]|nr:hypothetical protein AFLA_009363 [Aspergillus flavus NRRL3357]
MGSKGYPVPDRISHLREGGGGVDSFRHTNKLTSEAGIDRQFQGPITKVIRIRIEAATGETTQPNKLRGLSFVDLHKSRRLTIKPLRNSPGRNP